MLEGVPIQVSSTFITLIAEFIILLLFLLIKLAFALTEYGSTHAFIYKVLQTPIQNLTDSFLVILIIIILSQILWLLGVNGFYTVVPIFMPIWSGYITGKFYVVVIPF